MRYTEQAYEKTEAELAQRRQRSAAELEEKEKFVYSKAPEIYTLRQSLKVSCIKLVKLVASHDKDALRKAEELKEENLDIQKRIKTMVYDLTGDENYLEAKYVCERCHDTGYVEGIRCECASKLLKSYTINELNKQSSIALHDFSEFRSDYYDNEALSRQMVKYKNNFVSFCEHFPKVSQSYLFIGSTGLGKTFLSSCIAKTVIDKGFFVVFSSAPDLLRRIENEYFRREDGNTLDTALNADLLIIDDLASEFKNSFNDSAVYNIINGRLNLKKPTIISTNLDENQMNKRYDERITSRLLNEYTTFLFLGKDIRQVKNVVRARKK